MIPQDFIQQLLARVDIVDVVGKHVKLRRAGANFLGLCPFHGEKTPSFTVSPTKQFYHCFGCGVHGSAIGFLMEHSGLGYVDAIRELARDAGLTVPESRDIDPAAAAAAASESQSLLSVLEAAARHYRQRLKHADRAIAYLKGRGLTGPTAAQFGIGYAPAQWRGLEAAVPDYSAPVLATAGLVIDAVTPEPEAVSPASSSACEGDPSVAGEDAASHADRALPSGDEPRRSRRYDRFRDRIMFPIRNARGQVIGFGGRVLDSGEPKYLNSPETPVFSKGREIYGAFEGREAIRREDCVVVVEGYMDVVMLAQYGVGNAVATLGTATTPEHIQKLTRLAARLVFAFDGDAAGRKAASRALLVCLPYTSDTRRIDFLFLPPEHDPDSYVREHGIEGWRNLLDNTVALSEMLLREVSAQIDLATPEGRAMLLARAKPMLNDLAAPALRLQILHRLASISQLSPAEVERFIQPERGMRGASQPLGAKSGRAVERGREPRPNSRPDARPDSQRAGYRTEPARVRVPASAPDLEARARLLVALHPRLASTLEINEDWVPAGLAKWIGDIACLPAGSTFASVCEGLRASHASEVARLERAGGTDAAGLAELSEEEAVSELDGALAQLRSRWARQQIDQLIAAGISTEADRVRYAQLLKTMRSVVK